MCKVRAQFSLDQEICVLPLTTYPFFFNCAIPADLKTFPSASHVSMLTSSCLHYLVALFSYFVSNAGRLHCWGLNCVETFCYSQPSFLYPFGVVRLEHLEVRSWEFQEIPTFSVVKNTASCHNHFRWLSGQQPGVNTCIFTTQQAWWWLLKQIERTTRPNMSMTRLKFAWTTWKQKKEKETSLAFSYTINF